jgi:hypothetical protein
MSLMPEEIKVSRDLIKLRISVARIAQALGIAGDMQEMTAYERLWERAATQERGWNLLCGAIQREIEDMQFTVQDQRRAP